VAPMLADLQALWGDRDRLLRPRWLQMLAVGGRVYQRRKRR
jgi:hypothetical protein